MKDGKEPKYLSKSGSDLCITHGISVVEKKRGVVKVDKH